MTAFCFLVILFVRFTEKAFKKGELKMRVLIVDDEIKVCQLIHHLVKWDEFGMKVIGLVNDGGEAYDVICSQRPDIVITDIRMPGLDGIDLVEKVQQKMNDIYFVIISGYSQFEYARQAVKLGVEDYLLKPIRKKELEAVLKKISSKHTKSNEDKTEKEILKTELQQTREQIKNNLLMAMVMDSFGESSVSGKEEIQRKYGCALKGRYNYLIVAHFFENTMESSSDEYGFVLEKIQKSLRDKLEKCSLEVLSVIHDKEAVCLVNTDQSSEEELNQLLKKVSIEISSVREIYPEARVAYGVGALREDLKDYRDTLEKIHIALLERFENGDKYLFWKEKQRTGKSGVSDILSPDIRKQLLGKIELLDGDAVAQTVRSAGIKMKKLLPNGKTVYDCYLELVNLFLLGIGNYVKLESKPSFDYFLKGIYTFYELDDVVGWLENEFRVFINKYEQDQKDAEAKPIRLAKEYVREHYGETISLEIISRYIGLNPAYFSSVFKKTTGQNFMDYVTEVRVENAKSLLIRTDKDVADIAECAGYSDVKYFSKIFKKNAGLSPSEFRKLYG